MPMSLTEKCHSQLFTRPYHHISSIAHMPHIDIQISTQDARARVGCLSREPSLMAKDFCYWAIVA